MEKKPSTWRDDLAKICEVDWSRRNKTLWEGRVMNGARMNGQRRAVLLGAAVLYRQVGLTPEERMTTAEEGLEMERI